MNKTERVNRKFDAILSKNEIARRLRCVRDGEYGDDAKHLIEPIMFHLREIEKFIGQSNQPSVDDIIDTLEFDL